MFPYKINPLYEAMAQSSMRALSALRERMKGRTSTWQVQSLWVWERHCANRHRQQLYMQHNQCTPQTNMAFKRMALPPVRWAGVYRIASIYIITILISFFKDSLSKYRNRSTFKSDLSAIISRASLSSHPLIRACII